MLILNSYLIAEKMQSSWRYFFRNRFEEINIIFGDLIDHVSKFSHLHADDTWMGK